MGKILYGMPRTRSFRVLWALEEAGAEYRYQLINLGKGEGQRPDFLALNPAGKLPVLQEGDLVLTESAAICTYLADGCPEKKLVPLAGSGERALYYQWCFFVMAELEQPLWTMAKHKFALPKDYRVREVLETAAFEFSNAVKLLEQGLQRSEYLVDNSFTMADLLAAHTLMWAQALKLDPGSARLEDYQQGILQRPAWLRANRIETEKTKEMG